MAALIATPFRRRLAMAAMLALAVSGGVIRHYATAPSTLHDIGTLLLVMWLPAVGNLIGYLMRKLPRSAPPPTDFPAGSSFQPQLQVRIEPVPLPEGWLASLDPAEEKAVVLVGRHGFTTRAARPLAQWLAQRETQDVALELLRPDTALRELKPGTEFHLLVGTTAVAKGRVLPH